MQPVHVVLLMHGLSTLQKQLLIDTLAQENKLHILVESLLGASALQLADDLARKHEDCLCFLLLHVSALQ